MMDHIEEKENDNENDIRFKKSYFKNVFVIS
jgi:hypothetical protein